MQFQSDILNTRVVRPKMVDTTVAGAAYLAGVTIGLYKTADLGDFRGTDAVFVPKMPSKDVSLKYNGWQQAVLRARS